MTRFGLPDGTGPIRYIASLFPPAPAPGVPSDAGLFGPDSEVWRIGRERALIASGPAALLLQLAHPLIAAGVAQHSGFHDDPQRRLRGTLDATLTVVFGDHSQAVQAAERVAERHRHVNGRTDTSVGRYVAGTRFDATDPELALWVHATLVWTALEFYDGFIAPLTRQRRARYYAEMARFAALFGATEDRLPRSYPEFESYISAMDDDGVLQVGSQARTLAEEILNAGASSLPTALGFGVSTLTRVLAAGLLPARLRSAYGLNWGWREQQAFLAARLSSRTALRAMPPSLRYWPHYQCAQQRLRQG